VQAAPVAGVPLEQVQVFATQVLLDVLRVYPVAHFAHLTALFVVQAAAATGVPLGQVQVFATQILLEVLRVYPAVQLAHLTALFVVQAAPVAGVPLEQVQVFATQVLLDVLRVYPIAHFAHLTALFVVQAAPVAGVPLEQVQVFAAHLPPTCADKHKVPCAVIIPGPAPKPAVDEPVPKSCPGCVSLLGEKVGVLPQGTNWTAPRVLPWRAPAAAAAAVAGASCAKA